MPSKKKKYNARFPPGRIKKIMQTDEEVGKVAQAVPVIISRALELFVESLLTKAVEITSARNAKTLTPSHMKQCILSESRFDFLKEFVKTVPDLVGDTDDSPGPSGSSIGAMGSSMDESNPGEPSLSVEPPLSNGYALLVDTTTRGIEEGPLNLATGPLSLPVPPLHYFSAEAAAKSRAVSAGLSPSYAPASAAPDIDEDYDA